jgi:hypothetical protein
MSRTCAGSKCHLGTFLPYYRNTACDTLLLRASRDPGASMFIFQRPIVAPLLALAMVAMLVVLDTLVDLSALFR